MYKIVRTTGPHSNYLGLELTDFPVDLPAVVDLVRVRTADASLDSKEVLNQVLLGVADASHEIGHVYYVKMVQFLSTDSAPHEIYRFLAAEIIRRAHSIRDTQT